MPLLTLKEIADMSPVFRGRIGGAVGRGLMRMLSQLPSGPFVVISNHPYGSIDGIILVDMFARIRQDFKVMVNNFLGRIKTLENNFIGVTPTEELSVRPRQKKASKESRRRSLIYAPAILSEYFRQGQSPT